MSVKTGRCNCYCAKTCL